ncbi:hypothetical protein BGW80DRAFT_1372257 [Lactifluus volemus]|nr:hypothetical protein BGW80DRAFT_1372257 [Lactifluus volemus]
MEIKATTGRVSLTTAHLLGLLNTSSIFPSALARFGQSIMFCQPICRIHKIGIPEIMDLHPPT